MQTDLKKKLMDSFNENPRETILAIAAAAAAAAKVVDSVYGARSKSAYARTHGRRR